jgi:SAM-dependent methyltransferase
MSVDATAAERALIWHDVECGSYSGDLELWRELAAVARSGRVLELGCGTGRVALILARAEHGVTGLDHDAILAAELARRARSEGLPVDAVAADARDFHLGRRFGLVVAPMQLVHLLGGPEGRRSMLRCAAEHLTPSGRIAVALLSGDATSVPHASPPLPDVVERDSWVYSSLPLEVRGLPGALEVRRLRQAVSPAGDLSEELDVTRLDALTAPEFESEALESGLRPVERLEVAETADHVGSTVVVLEVGS